MAVPARNSQISLLRKMLLNQHLQQVFHQYPSPIVQSLTFVPDTQSLAESQKYLIFYQLKESCNYLPLLSLPTDSELIQNNFAWYLISHECPKNLYNPMPADYSFYKYCK